MRGLWRRLSRLFGVAAVRGEFESRINVLTMTPQGYVRKQAGPAFTRGPHRYDPRQLLHRESAFLKRLDGRHAPRVIAEGDDWFEMEHCGVELSEDNLPADWRDQVAAIASALAEAGIIHRDIKPGNVSVKEGQLYLIDFGWAVWTDEVPYLSPRELSSEVPHEHIYDNRAALEWLVSSYTR